MSLLSPESVSVGLFPGSCWIRRGGAELASQLTDTHATPPQLLAALASMLDEQPQRFRRRIRLQLLVSDSLAAVIPLPWQDLLRTEQEQRGYALACYQQRGIQAGDGWVMHAGFRHFGGLGLAWALPEAWMRELLAVLDARGLKLERVLPVSASAYWHGAGAGSGRRIVLLRERSRQMALVYEGRRLSGVDVQPVANSEITSLHRLLKRIAATHGVPDQLDEWNPDELEPLSAAVELCFPGVAQQVLPRLVWC